MRRIVLPVVALLSLGAALAGCGAVVPRATVGPGLPSTAGRGLSASTFAEIDLAGAGVLADVRTGRPIRTLLPARRGRLTLVDLSRDGRAGLVVTYATGPECTSGIAGCGPKPNTCGGQVDRLNPATGTLTRLVTFRRSTEVLATRPNPYGTELALLVGPCVPSYFNQHVEVLDLVTGRSWTIGAGLPRCHVLSPPAWVYGGADLLIPYGAARGTQPYTGADGVCTESHRAALVEVRAEAPQPGLSGLRRGDRRHCDYAAVASQGRATYAISRCDTHDHTAPDVLQRLGTDLRPVAHWRIGQCEDGDSLALSPTGRVLVSAYLFCNPPLHGKVGEPVSDLDLLAHGRLTHLTHRGGGDLVYSDLAW